jgi:hypothetical protein
MFQGACSTQSGRVLLARFAAKESNVVVWLLLMHLEKQNLAYYFWSYPSWRYARGADC